MWIYWTKFSKHQDWIVRVNATKWLEENQRRERICQQDSKVLLSHQRLEDDSTSRFKRTNFNSRGIHLNATGTSILARDYKAFINQHWLSTWETEGSIYNKTPKVRGFKFVSINITSLLAHIDELRVWVENQNIDVLAINESRLDASIPNSCVSITNYNIVRKDRNRNGGGVAVYIYNSVNYTNSSHLIPETMEAVCIDILKPNSRPFSIVSCYRPPNKDSIIVRRPLRPK